MRAGDERGERRKSRVAVELKPVWLKTNLVTWSNTIS